MTGVPEASKEAAVRCDRCGRVGCTDGRDRGRPRTDL